MKDIYLVLAIFRILSIQPIQMFTQKCQYEKIGGLLVISLIHFLLVYFLLCRDTPKVNFDVSASASDTSASSNDSNGVLHGMSFNRTLRGIHDEQLVSFEFFV